MDAVDVRPPDTTRLGAIAFGAALLIGVIYVGAHRNQIARRRVSISVNAKPVSIGDTIRSPDAFRSVGTREPRASVQISSEVVRDNRMDRSPAAVASLVDGARQGDEQALATLVPLVYDELRRLAASYLRRERPGQTLQATALVHDAYLRLLQDSQLSWQNRAHFFGIAARSMRQILIERARARHAAKRGGDRVRVTFDPDLIVGTREPIDFEALDDALTRLAALDPDLARIVEVRFFGGLSIEETAEATGVSPATVKRRWTLAKAWLARDLGGEEARES